MCRPSLEAVTIIFGQFLKDYKFLLNKFETDKKWVIFSNNLNKLIKQLGCENYPELYESEEKIQSVLLQAMFENNDQIDQLIAEIDSNVKTENYRPTYHIINEIMEGQFYVRMHPINIQEIELPPEMLENEKMSWENLSPEQQLSLRQIRYSLQYSLASFHNYFALMMHGQKLTQLVELAKKGNDESFYKAIQIDKNILHGIPYFKQKYQKALDEGTQDFIATVGRRLAKPHISGKIRHGALYILFALLEGTGWLDELKHREILDICDRVGFERYAYRIESENALTKSLQNYKNLQNNKKP